MKILLVSDSHMFNEYLIHVVKRYKSKVDVMIHCGDSSLPMNDPLLQPFDIVVKGNHDDAPFPKYSVYKNIFITHGQYNHVYSGYDELIQLCHAHHCQICFHGHTHVPTYQYHDGILFINPGSLMMNRGQYGYGTYALIEIENNQVNVDFLHHQTDEICPHEIIVEGYELLEEFKKLV